MTNQARSMDIAELAEQVARENGDVGSVEPATIIDRRSITMSYGHYGESFDGMLECLNRRFHIYCNLDRVQSRNSPRARFTLGHELGHFFIDEHRNALLLGLSPAHPSHCDYESNNSAEQEADHFASNLLMPASRFVTAGRPTPRGLQGIVDLAHRFRTSISSTAIRYAQLEIAPCAVLKWNREGIGWKWLSARTYAAGYRKTAERSNQLPIDSATARAIRGDPAGASGYFECGTTAAAWFPHVSDGARENIILIEQSMSLGKFGVLTVLFPESGEYPVRRL